MDESRTFDTRLRAMSDQHDLIYIDGKPEVTLDRKYRPDSGAIHCYAPEFVDEPGSGISFDREHLVHLCDNCAELCDAHYVEGYDGDCVECELCGKRKVVG